MDCTCNRDFPEGASPNPDPDCPVHGDGANTPRATADTITVPMTREQADRVRGWLELQEESGGIYWGYEPQPWAMDLLAKIREVAPKGN